MAAFRKAGRARRLSRLPGDAGPAFAEILDHVCAIRIKSIVIEAPRLFLITPPVADAIRADERQHEELQQLMMRLGNPDDMVPHGGTMFEALAGTDTDTMARSAEDPNTWGRVGRNELCPCGSGKKYKHCHGARGA